MFASALAIHERVHADCIKRAVREGKYMVKATLWEIGTMLYNISNINCC